MPANFDSQFAERVVPVDPHQRTAMGPRYFQVLVDKRIGSNVITQFIGHIPPSKAAPHRHSLEATSPDGIDVVGVICPGDNPSINYYD